LSHCRRVVDPVSNTEGVVGEHVKVTNKEKPKVKEEPVAKDEVKLKVKIIFNDGECFYLYILRTFNTLAVTVSITLYTTINRLLNLA